MADGSTQSETTSSADEHAQTAPSDIADSIYQRPPDYNESVDNPLYMLPHQKAKRDMGNKTKDHVPVGLPTYDDVEKGQFEVLNTSDAQSIDRLVKKARRGRKSSKRRKLDSIAEEAEVGNGPTPRESRPDFRRHSHSPVALRESAEESLPQEGRQRSRSDTSLIPSHGVAVDSSDSTDECRDQNAPPPRYVNDDADGILEPEEDEESRREPPPRYSYINSAFITIEEDPHPSSSTSASPTGDE